MSEALVGFSPPVRDWFTATFGAATPPQVEGWPPIQRGEHTLILAPTGSGKTLAAFLWGIDRLYRQAMGDDGGSVGDRPQQIQGETGHCMSQRRRRWLRRHRPSAISHRRAPVSACSTSPRSRR